MGGGVAGAGVTYDSSGIDAAMGKLLQDSSLAAEVADLPAHAAQLGDWLKASL